MPSAIFHRTPDQKYPRAVAGQGIYLRDEEGKLILDGSCGAAVSCLGHGNQEVIDAIIDQAQRMAFAHTSFFTSDPAESLASLLIASAPGVFSHAMFLSSGSEAVESALKLARQYHICRGEPRRQLFISRRYSYHGNTLGALSAGFNPPRRDAFEPMLSPAFHHVSPCFYSRDGRPRESEDAYVDRLMDEFEHMFCSLGADRVAAVMVEPVSGATLGAVPAARGYLGRLRSLCDRHGCLLVFDEVMCGMGRVGSLHAWQSPSLGGIAPDLQTIGKGLGAGYQPISAVLTGPKVYEALSTSKAQHPFVSGHTYQGHAIGCAAALAVQRILARDRLLDHVQCMGHRLKARLQSSTPRLKEVRGLGLFLAVEFATPASSSQRMAPAVAATCLENGLAVYLCSAAVDAVLFAPPFIISAAEVDKLVDLFVESVHQVCRAEPLTIQSRE